MAKKLVPVWDGKRLFFDDKNLLPAQENLTALTTDV